MVTHLLGSGTALSRRDVVAGTGLAGLAVAAICLAPALGLATPAQVEVEIKRRFSGRSMAEGKIKLDLPTIAENGLVVPLNFDVESPMTAADYVKSITFFAESNPNPVVAAFHFTPLIPKAAGQIRIRLAQTQMVTAVAEMSDGTVYAVKREVKVTIGGCGG